MARIVGLFGILSVLALASYAQAATKHVPYWPLLSRLAAPKECSINFKDFPDKEPVLFRKNKAGYSFIEPQDQGVTFKANEEIYIGCPGGKNVIDALKQEFVAAKCKQDDTFTVGKDTKTFPDFACTKDVNGEVEETLWPCGANKGVIKHIGDNINNTWVTLFDVCYDNSQAGALYADHIVYGSAIKSSKRTGTRPSFKTPGVPKNVKATDAYKTANQLVTFTEILGSKAYGEKYIGKNSFLAKGHLSPDADFIFVSSQHSSYFFINVVPQWQAVNNGNWKSLEFAVRSLSATSKKNYRVITGSHDILKLKNTKGVEKEMYLAADDKIPVPKFVWKIMQDVETQEAIAFVTSNNPFLEEVTKDLNLCKDICSQNGWGAATWKNLQKGYQYCCTVADLAKVVKTVPAVKASGVLQFTSSAKLYMRSFF